MNYLGYFEAVVTGTKDNHKVSLFWPDRVDLIIMRGCPGSFKSTVAKHIQSHLANSVICSTDDYHMVDGVYKFNRQMLGNYHNFNLKAATTALMDGRKVIVDNTNTTLFECLKYIAMAQRNGRTFCFVEPVGQGCNVAAVLAERNVHQVPLDAIKAMLDRWHSKEQIEFGLKCLTEWDKLNVYSS
jgi:predicted kinase